MSRPPKLPEDRKPKLTKEDRALWEKAAETIKPLKQKRHRVSHASPSKSHATPHAVTRAVEIRTASRSAPERATNASAGPTGARAPAAAPDLSKFDRKAARKLGRGQREIEARLDLHGLRQGEAHAALRRFLLGCFARGERWVLVITGKGAASSRRGHEDSLGFGYGAPERGVLKRSVPGWLAEPELRAIVVSYTEAAVSHGGEGALYIQLRNPERLKPRT